MPQRITRDLTTTLSADQTRNAGLGVVAGSAVVAVASFFLYSNNDFSVFGIVGFAAALAGAFVAMRLNSSATRKAKAEAAPAAPVEAELAE